jgi:DNA (cytosine-5)-methyltransferase 1
MEKIRVVDLFAGPGGLGEGFSQFVHPRLRFDVCLSVEKDEAAARTLRLRKLFRLIKGDRHLTSLYYDYLRGCSRLDHEGLMNRAGNAGSSALNTVLCATLGYRPHDVLITEKLTSILKKSDCWVLIGGPPCQAYSIVGRSKLRSLDERKYRADHRHTLYREYLKVLHEYGPAVFVMENVKGMLTSKLGRDTTAFERIFADLQNPGHALGRNGGKRYTILPLATYSNQRSLRLADDWTAPESFLIESERHGVPQSRHRVILLGVEKGFYPPYLSGLKDRNLTVSVEEAIDDLPPVRSSLSREPDSFETWKEIITKSAKRCLAAGIKTNSLSSLSRGVFDLRKDPGQGGRFVEAYGLRGTRLATWIGDPELGGVLNHEARSHIRSDFARYMFVASFTEMHRRCPKLPLDFPRVFLPSHENVSSASVPFKDRFRAQRRDRPASTITSHISKDGHYFIHYDAEQCRSLTVREAARIQTFPDNYFFEGYRTEQYVQVGNAVPPLLAHQIAGIVADVLLGASVETKAKIKVDA